MGCDVMMMIYAFLFSCRLPVMATMRSGSGVSYESGSGVSETGVTESGVSEGGMRDNWSGVHYWGSVVNHRGGVVDDGGLVVGDVVGVSVAAGVSVSTVSGCGEVTSVSSVTSVSVGNWALGLKEGKLNFWGKRLTT